MRHGKSMAVALAVATVLMGLALPAHRSDANIAVGLSTSVATTTNASPLAITVPGSVAQFDVLVAQVVVKTTTTTVTAPSGWTLIRADNSAGANPLKMSSYWHVATAGDASGGSYSWSYTGTNWAAGGMLVLKGVDNAGPVDVSATATDTNSPSTAPAVTTTVANTVLVLLDALEKNDACSAISSGAFAYSVAPTGGGGNAKVAACAATRAVAAAGASGTTDFTISANDAAVLQTIAFRMPKASFSSSSASGAEATTSVSIPVALTGATSSTATVAFASSGTATAGASCTGTTDYMIAASPASFSAGTTSQTIAVTVCDDALGESSETISLTLSTPAQAVLGATTVFTYTITDNDLFVTPAADPVKADGTADTGLAWGAWAADPGATNVASANYVKLSNTGDQPTRAYTVDFTAASLTGQSDATQTIVLDSNVQFACWQDTTPGATSPTEAGSSYAFGATSATSSTSGSFSGLGNIVYCKYQILALPATLGDQEYVASYTVT
ncbi:MAG: Calx-beta domain-containing protein [bacterium]